MKHQALCIVIGIGVGASAVSCADRAVATKPTDDGMVMVAKGNPELESLEFDGTIGKIDADNGSITVERWPLSKKFRVPPECEINVSTNANATLAQLKVNDPWQSLIRKQARIWSPTASCVAGRRTSRSSGRRWSGSTTCCTPARTNRVGRRDRMNDACGRRLLLFPA